MNKKSLVSAISEKLNVSKKDAEKFLNDFVDIVSESLEKGESVKLVGFGTFEVVKREERKGINPQTKETIIIPAKKVPKFKAGTELKNRVM
ncbi:transcriptional regulator [Tepiditoga spiralis]|uniref:Transcriptional regulator n=1 Tax=Tepiditoga spiralis TaxID=2108365 RepID=A0A7G1G2T0_9BACT|nr:HU family DNA-binding protein [Tepiditoga spiralis]BBE30185.1 transcriptional regulator [Tepiditoga spiralis]